MKPEDAVAYTEALSIRHGSELHRHPDVIEKFVSEAELRIEKAAKETT
jgi:response regulator RpfG family c-di-GMP phosphodiesterase